MGCVQETVLCISDELTYDRHAVHHFVKVTNDHFQGKRLLNIEKEVQISDGCTGQYKACGPFRDFSYSQDDYGFKIDCNFYESHHGKRPSDGAATVIKQTARRAVNSQQALINQSLRISSVPTAIS